MSAAHRRARADRRTMCAHLAASFNATGIPHQPFTVIKGMRPVDLPRVYSFSPNDQPVVQPVAPTRGYEARDYRRHTRRPESPWKSFCKFIDEVASTVTEVRGVKFSQESCLS